MLTEAIATAKPIFKDYNTQHSLEIELLLLSIRPQLNDASIERILELTSQNIDWDYVIQTAIEHKVAPLIYNRLKNICPSQIPTENLQEMRQVFYNNTKKNLVLTEKLFQIIELLRNNDIPCLTFKGITLAVLAYQKIGLRTFTDLDILVPEEFIPQTSKLLIDRGYQPQFSFNESQQKAYLQMRNEHMFVHPKGDITLDLHWSLLGDNFSFCGDREFIWKDLQDININGKLVSSLSPEIMVLYLCANGAKDSWIYLQSISDLARFIDSHPDLNWERVIDRSGSLGTERMLSLGLYLCQDILDLSLPEKIKLKIHKEPQVKKLVREIESNLFADLKSKNILFRRQSIYLKTMESWQDKTAFYFNIIRPTPLEWEIIALPKWLSSLYYPIRLIRLAIKHGLRKMI
jgi:hypothetical protein